MDKLALITYMRHEPKRIMCLHTFQGMTDVKEVLIGIHKMIIQQILCAWCQCMPGNYEKCNFVIICLYKVDYTNTKRFCNPSSIEQVCAWSQGSKKKVVPKRIAALFLRKRLVS